MSTQPLPNRPGLRDAADWKAIQLPETEAATPHGKHWAALLRLFSWQIQRVAELEERVQKLEADLAPFLVPLPMAELVGEPLIPGVWSVDIQDRLTRLETLTAPLRLSKMGDLL